MEANGQTYFGDFVTQEDVDRLRAALSEEQRERADKLIKELVAKKLVDKR